MHRLHSAGEDVGARRRVGPTAHSGPSGIHGASSHAEAARRSSSSARPPARNAAAARGRGATMRGSTPPRVAPMAALVVLVSRSLRLASRPGTTRSWSSSTVNESRPHTSTVRPPRLAGEPEAERERQEEEQVGRDVGAAVVAADQAQERRGDGEAADVPHRRERGDEHERGAQDGERRPQRAPAPRAARGRGGDISGRGWGGRGGNRRYGRQGKRL